MSGSLFSVLLGVYLEMELLNEMVILCVSVFQELPNFPLQAVLELMESPPLAASCIQGFSHSGPTQKSVCPD